EVLERLRIVRVDRLRVDLDLGELARSRRLHDDGAAARGALDDRVRRLLLRTGDLLLHLLGLLHHLVQVHQSSTSRASKVSLISETKSSSVVICGSASEAPSCGLSPSSYASLSFRPVTS